MSQKASPIDEAMMARAIALALRGFPAPNPRVGCVIARGEEVIGEGFHAYAGGPHAEVVALQKARERARGAAAYVTLEPCNHHGRTPPCVDALLEARVARVVAACPDPVPSHGGGLARLRGSGVETLLGVLHEKARKVNLAWLAAVERSRPYIVVKAAMTLDGRIATPAGESKWITGEEARREAHRLRAECGAVLVGRATVERDDPRLTVRGLRLKNQPVRVVLDPSRRLSPDRRVFDREAPSIRVVAVEPQTGDLQTSYESGAFDLAALARALYLRGLTGLLVEGGAITIGTFLDAGLVDRLELFVAGKVFGAGKPWVERSFDGPIDLASRFQIQRVRRRGNDVWLTCVANG
ncbi:MAG: bifunctional diaminohydroxyphosphoribosylaminopyrimidine deaminase/5-amino-6-(5-phosphoribosylamino)uracil reductase RibD [Fimbriimonadales bacterium]